MLDILIISVGKISEPYWQGAITEYVRRLKPYAKTKFIEVAEEKFDKVTDRRRVLKQEGERIEKVIPGDSIVVALDRTGVNFSSTEWADKLEEWSRFGQKIVFVIGGPLGLSTEILTKANVLLSFSKMTFTHQMVRVILLEQIYRGNMILTGKTYHY